MKEPLLILRLLSDSRNFYPAEVLRAEYRLELPEPRNLRAIEASVLWYTEGKGEEDIGVHYFARHLSEELAEMNWPKAMQFETVLPRSPLSYDGVIVRVHWCARVRVFLSRGRQTIAEQPFRLGGVPPAVPVVHDGATAADLENDSEEAANN